MDRQVPISFFNERLNRLRIFVRNHYESDSLAFETIAQFLDCGHFRHTWWAPMLPKCLRR